jgi:hypothetical protein
MVRFIGPYISRPKASAGIPSHRDKPHLLILRNKFYSKYSKEMSTEKMQLDNTLRASKLATFEVITYDHDLLISPFGDFQIIAKCRDIRPDAIILSSWGKASRHPSVESLRFIRERMKIPLAAIWWDTCSENVGKALQPLMGYFDVNVIIENPNLYHFDKEDPLFHRILPLWAPQDENLYCPGVTRDIPVSFLGQVSSYRSVRKEYIDYLVDQKVDGYFSTNDRVDQVSHAEYGKLMSRSKIALNFSHSVTGHQLKGRIFDAMLSGAMLLESENDQITQLFTPMKDYVPFSSKEDMLNKIRYYLSNQKEAVAIAEQGQLTAIKNYNSNRFWRLFLNKLELIDML